MWGPVACRVNRELDILHGTIQKNSRKIIQFYSHEIISHHQLSPCVVHQRQDFSLTLLPRTDVDAYYKYVMGKMKRTSILIGQKYSKM